MDDHSRGQPVRVAFVGAGKMAQLHYRALRHVDTPFVLVGACDVVQLAAENLTSAVPGAKAYTDAKRMIEEQRPDIVHIVTPAGMHYEPARLAIENGASIYVEKPFTEFPEEASELLALARQKGVKVCAGHQLLKEAVFEELLSRVERVGEISSIDSDFHFSPAAVPLHRSGPRVRAAQLLDVLPHPLYSLLALLEHVNTDGDMIQMNCRKVTPSEVHVLLHMGDIIARLQLSLEARPVKSSIQVRGSAGTVHADLMTATIVGPGNTGTKPLEKMLNPLLDGLQTQFKTVFSVGKRILSGGDYPGLAEMFSEFYAAVATGKPSPLSDEHIVSTVEFYEQIADRVQKAASSVSVKQLVPPRDAPMAVVTGARGLLGKELTRTLSIAGYMVRGISRGADRDNPYVQEWIEGDLSREAPSAYFYGAEIVVHAAAATSGGFEAHQRNSIQATRNVLQGMQEAGCARLIHISSIATLAPAGSTYREDNPVYKDARHLGPYIWGKAESEHIVADEAPGMGIDAKIVRPSALVEWRHPELPGMVGRQLFGKLHLGLGRGGLPASVIDVCEAADMMGWMARHFDEAPDVVNLLDDRISTRADLIARYRSLGWKGRVLWFPVSLLALALNTVRALQGVVGSKPDRQDAWKILRPKRYEAAVARRIRLALEAERSADEHAPQTAGEQALSA